MGADAALAQIGAEASFTVSYAVAAELRKAAIASGIAAYELIAVVLLAAVVLAAIPASVRRGVATAKLAWKRTRRNGQRARNWQRQRGVGGAHAVRGAGGAACCEPLARLLDWLLLPDPTEERGGAVGKQGNSDGDGEVDGVDAREEPFEAPHSRSFLAFLEVLVATGRRIAVALLVQVVAATAVADQSLRIDRVLALLSVAVFFIFLQSGATAVGN